MKSVKLLLMLVGCLLGYNLVYASALADTEQSSGPIKIPYQITATAIVPGSGKVILAGYYENSAGYKQLFIGRENTTGTGLDTTFGTCYHPTATTAPLSGYTILGNDTDATLSATANWIPTAVFIDTAASLTTHYIVIVGTCQDAQNTTSPQQGFIVRLTVNGALDTTFGSATNPNQGYNLFGPSDLNLPAPTPPAAISPIVFSSVSAHYDTGLTISRYLIVGSGNPQGIVVAIQSGTTGTTNTDGQLDTTFNGTGVFTATGDTLGAAATDPVAFNSLQYYTDVAYNLNYYIAGYVKTSGILLALSIVTGTNTPPGTPTSPVALQTSFGQVPSTGGSPTGYISVPGNLLGGSAGASVVFNELIQSNTTPNDWYIIGQLDKSTAFLVSILLAGSSINSGGFNASAATVTTFGKTPGVVIINSNQLGQTGSVQFSSLIQKADRNYYISGVAGNSSFIASIINSGTAFNTAFGPVSTLGYIALSFSQVGLLEAPNITQALWDPTSPGYFYLLSSDTLDSSPGVASSVAKIVANGSALATASYTGTIPGITNPFSWLWKYIRNTGITGASGNVYVTILQTPVGQAIQLLAPSNNPLLPPAAQRLSIASTVFDMTNCIYDANANEFIIVGAVYLDNAGAAQTNAYIARFTANLIPDTIFGVTNPGPAGGSYGYQNFDASAFGGAAGDPALFFSVLLPDINGNYTVAGSVDVGGAVYEGLIAQIINNGTAIATTSATFNNPTGYKAYSSADLGGAGNNAVLTGILQNTNFYVIGMTYVTTAIIVQPLNTVASTANVGNGVIADITNLATGAINTTFAITPVTFGLTAGVHTQLSSFIQNSAPIGNYFVVVANLPGTTNGVTTTNRAGICAITNSLSGVYTTFGIGNTGYTLFDSSSFGEAVATNSMVRFENMQLLTNDDLLLLGKIVPNTAAGTPIKQTLVAQIKPTGVFNTRLDGTGYILGSTSTSLQGTMIAYSQNIISILGVDGGIFVFGSGVAGGTTNLVEIALIKRYGL